MLTDYIPIELVGLDKTISVSPEAYAKLVAAKVRGTLKVHILQTSNIAGVVLRRVEIKSSAERLFDFTLPMTIPSGLIRMHLALSFGTPEDKLQPSIPF